MTSSMTASRLGTTLHDYVVFDIKSRSAPGSDNTKSENRTSVEFLQIYNNYNTFHQNITLLRMYQYNTSSYLDDRIVFLSVTPKTLLMALTALPHLTMLSDQSLIRFRHQSSLVSFRKQSRLVRQNTYISCIILFTSSKLHYLLCDTIVADNNLK